MMEILLYVHNLSKSLGFVIPFLPPDNPGGPDVQLPQGKALYLNLKNT